MGIDLEKMVSTEFIWDDGGRAACGFVGLTGDCVTRAISIATGTVYRNVYDKLGAACQKSPRNGVPTDVAAAYLAGCHWQCSSGYDRPFEVYWLPMGRVIVHVAREQGQHFCTLIDRVVHDTWNPVEDEDYVIKSYWTCDQLFANADLPNHGTKPRENASQDLTQSEFDKILHRLRALDNTAKNGASTEAEKHNALRMMQSLMLRNNLSREDITSDDNVENVQFARIACPVNGRRACGWEKDLAFYVTRDVISSVQYFMSTRGHRTLFSFYGPLADVRNAISLFRELLLTIACAAQLQFGDYTRGSGASYAEGYVNGLPCSKPVDTANSKLEIEKAVSEHALIRNRTMAVQSAAKDWLKSECNITLSKSSRAGRYQHDAEATLRGQLHGSKHEVTVPKGPKRLTQK